MRLEELRLETSQAAEPFHVPICPPNFQCVKDVEVRRIILCLGVLLSFFCERPGIQMSLQEVAFHEDRSGLELAGGNMLVEPQVRVPTDVQPRLSVSNFKD